MTAQYLQTKQWTTKWIVKTHCKIRTTVKAADQAKRKESKILTALRVVHILNETCLHYYEMIGQQNVSRAEERM